MTGNFNKKRSHLLPKPYPAECLIAGSISGSAGVLVCHPMDVIRTRMQTSKVAKGVMECFRDVIRESGVVKGLYRGLSGPFVAQALYKSVIFTSNTMINTYIFTGQKTAVTTFLSGAIAGSMNAFIVSPVEIIRTRQILLPNSTFSGTLRSIISEGGINSLWRGLLPAMARDGPGIGVYLLTFEHCKLALDNNGTLSKFSIWSKLLSGASAGIAFWVVALPIDTIKANIEASPPSTTWNQLYLQQRQWIQQRGIGHLFRAWPVAFGRGIPSAAVTLTTFDVVSEALAQRRLNKLSIQH